MKPSAVPSDLPVAFQGVHLAHVERIFWLLREKLPRVLAANRYFEEQTGLHNEAGRNNLIDALSHLGTLVESAEELGPDGQAKQIALMEDHLRRSMMEGFEQLLRLRLGRAAEIWDDLSPLERWHPDARLPGDEEVEATRRRIVALLDRGRASKRAADWDAWEQGTDYLVKACDLAVDLDRRLERGMADIEWQRQNSRARTYAIIVTTSVTMLLVGAVIGWLFG
ncbi:MAG TPA: hypothetical protein VEW67_09685 [Thermoleophilaceae bacterium]|nr:hypothetical protein [Thermoleophilaceae bacterium]